MRFQCRIFTLWIVNRGWKKVVNGMEQLQQDPYQVRGPDELNDRRLGVWWTCHMWCDTRSSSFEIGLEPLCNTLPSSSPLPKYVFCKEFLAAIVYCQQLLTPNCRCHNVHMIFLTHCNVSWDVWDFLAHRKRWSKQDLMTPNEVSEVLSMTGGNRAIGDRDH